MSRDLDALAGQIVMLVKTALVPVLERLATVETFLKSLDGLRDRVVAMETKTAQVVQPEPTPPVDLTPLMERLAVMDTLVKQNADLRDKVIALESRPQTQPVLALSPEDEDRLKTLELRAEGPSLAEMGIVELRKALGDLQAELRYEVRENITLRERLAVLESRPSVTGPKGEPGPAGKDGLGFDDLSVEFDGDRTLALKFARGDVAKTFPITLPFLRYKGVYQHGQEYVQGDTVTSGNQMWYCHEPTITPPSEGSKTWQLCVRKGRDGRDGRDAATLPVVSVGGRS